MRTESPTGFVTPELLDEDELAAVTAVMVEARAVVYSIAERVYGEPCIRRFRLDYEAGRLDAEVTPEDRRRIDRLRPVEVRLVAAFARLAAQRARAFTRSRTHPALVYDDYFNEACLAIADVAWSYNGTSLLYQYVRRAVQNRLQDVARLGPFSMMGPTAYKFRSELRRRVDAAHPLDDVLADLGVSGVEAVYARRSLAVRHSLPGTGVLDVVDDSGACDRSWERLREAVDRAPLTGFQRDLFAAFYQGIDGFQTVVAARNRDGRTGEPYRAGGKPFTRQHANQQWHRAVELVRRTYDRLDAA